MGIGTAGCCLECPYRLRQCLTSTGLDIKLGGIGDTGSMPPVDIICHASLVELDLWYSPAIASRTVGMALCTSAECSSAYATLALCSLANSRSRRAGDRVRRKYRTQRLMVTRAVIKRCLTWSCASSRSQGVRHHGTWLCSFCRHDTRSAYVVPTGCTARRCDQNGWLRGGAIGWDRGLDRRKVRVGV